jgi:hypothetical protein
VQRVNIFAALVQRGRLRDQGIKVTDTGCCKNLLPRAKMVRLL